LVMRHIMLGDGLRLRFPGRSSDFDDGVEIGALAAAMDLGQREFSRWISPDNVDQARALAGQLGYYVVEGPTETGAVEVTFRSKSARPALKLVHSAG
jgi:hypothetical protein